MLVVASLMFIVRPINVLACTIRSGLNWREKVFLSWLAPRGIVAAAVASLFYDRLSVEGIEGGAALRALVFLVIAVTVVFQGATGAPVARWLGVRRPTGQGYTILGAEELARELARVLQESGEEVVLVDANAGACTEAEKEGFKVVYGNALEERVLLQADVESRKGAIGALHNGAVNLLFATKARQEYKVPKAYVAIQRGHDSIDPGTIEEAGASVLFGGETDLEMWSVRIRRDLASTEVWHREEIPTEEESSEKMELPRDVQNALLPLALRADNKITPFDDGAVAGVGDEVFWLVFQERHDGAKVWFEGHGWRRGAESQHSD